MSADRRLLPLPVPSSLREKLLVSPDEAADRLSITRRRVFELIKRGELRSVKLGKRRLISLDALREFVARLEEGQP